MTTIIEIVIGAIAAGFGAAGVVAACWQRRWRADLANDRLVPDTFPEEWLTDRASR